MADTGIGASVKRKEDQRFITGKGQYTDDINRPGQTCAVFVRSPHAHANIQEAIDAVRRAGLARLPRRLHRRRHRQGQGRRPDLRLDDPLQGRLADEGRRASRRSPRARCATSAITWPWSSPRRWRRPRMRPRLVAVDYEVLPAVVDVATAQSAGQPQMHAERPTTPSTSGTSATRPRSMRPSPAPSTSPRSTSSTTA